MTVAVRVLDLLYQKLYHVGIGHLSVSQPAYTSSKLTRETLEQGVKYVQS